MWSKVHHNDITYKYRLNIIYECLNVMHVEQIGKN